MYHFPPQAVTCSYPSPLGLMALLATDDALLGAWFEDQQHFPVLDAFQKLPGHVLLEQARSELNDYFSKRRNAFTLPLGWAGGTTFQQSVWQGLRAIPAGTTCTYGAIAQAIGHPAAVRAVGGAIGRNPFSIFVPCHRVLGARGAMTGYAGGLPRKIALLQLESAI